MCIDFCWLDLFHSLRRGANVLYVYMIPSFVKQSLLACLGHPHQLRK